MAHEAVWVQVTIPEDKTEEFLKVRAATAAAGHLCPRAQRISSVTPRHCSDTLPHRDGTPALLAEGPVAEASRARAEADLARHQAAAARRAGESRWRAKQRAIRIWWWRAIWREVETARARVQQIARIVAKGQWRGRYPEVLIVEHATLLMELLSTNWRRSP